MLNDILLPRAHLKRDGAHHEARITRVSEALQANATYFSNPEWAQDYLTHCHRDGFFKERWIAAGGEWTGKVVVDLGCGPGNIFANLGGRPALLIGVDVAAGSLDYAAELGYTTILADAAEVPLVAQCADIVAINASLHHCDDMEAVLVEAARLVKPGGVLITDHDPQRSAWDYKGVAKLLWGARLWLYRITQHGFHKTGSQQYWGLKSEAHHKPGDGVSEALYRKVLEPLGFQVRIHAHNHQVGAAALSGDTGPAQWKYRMGNLLSGRWPNASSSALSLMCIAKRAQARQPPTSLEGPAL